MLFKIIIFLDCNSVNFILARYFVGGDSQQTVMKYYLICIISQFFENSPNYYSIIITYKQQNAKMFKVTL